MTDEQIIKALECCVKVRNCGECPAKDEPVSKCLITVCEKAAGIIKCQKAEIEDLKSQMEWLTGYNGNLLDANTALSGEIEICKSEAIKEFAEKIKQRERIMKYDLFPEYAVSVKDIDDIVKEMTEADK